MQILWWISLFLTIYFGLGILGAMYVLYNDKKDRYELKFWLIPIFIIVFTYTLIGCNHSKSDGDDSYFAIYDSYSVYDKGHFSE